MTDAATSLPLAPRRQPRRLLLSWLYLRVLLYEFRWTLVLLAGAVLIGTLILLTAWDESGQRISIGFAFYDAWMSLLAQPSIAPTRWYVGAMHMIYPLLGVSLIGEGVVRLALLLVSKRQGEKEWMKVMAYTCRDHVILCGLGHLGFRVLEQLLAQQMEVVILESNERSKFVEQARALGVPLLFGDMKQDKSLLDAGIKHARSIVVCTNDDMANLEVALDARRLNPNVRVVMRLFEQDIAHKVSGALTIDAVFSASSLAAPVVAAMSLGSKVLASMSIGGVAYAACELCADDASGLIGKTVATVEKDMGARALALLRDHQNIPPPLAAHEIHAGDLLIMCSPTRNLSKLNLAKPK